MFYYRYDPTYLLLITGLLLALYAQIKVSDTYSKWKRVSTRSRMTGAEMARLILDGNGCGDVRIERVAGKLTDHYDPQDGVLRLSNEVYSSDSVAAIGIAAHEAGHAVQYAVGYGPIKLRAAIVPAVNFGSKLSMPLLLIGLLLMSFTRYAELRTVFYYIALSGVACFGLCVFFQLVTLPTEFNASRRAMQAIRTTHLLDDEECTAARKTLTAAALTYVAAMTVSLLQFLRLLSMFSRRRD